MTANHLEHKIATFFPDHRGGGRRIGGEARGRGGLEQREMTVESAYEGANVDDPQELLNIARHHCQAIQTIIEHRTAAAVAKASALSLPRSAEESRWLMQHQRKPRLLSTGASSSAHHWITTSKGPFP